MKIFIPFKIKDVGGTSTFASIFSEELKKRDLEVVFSFEKNYDILFVIADCPLKYVFDAKIRNKKIIQRLDGVYNPAANGWIYPLLNLKMKIIYRWFANFVIYQSNFSKLSCEKFLGKKNNNYAIIYNGVAIPEYKPRNDIKENSKIKLITFSKFRREDQIRPIVEAVKKLPEKFHLDIYGNYSKNLSSLFSEINNYPNMLWKGQLPHSKLLKIISDYDIFLFSDQSACPNSVLEALGAGLPVAAYSRGSIDELIKTGYDGEITLLGKHDQFTNKYPFEKENYQKLAENIEKISQNLEFYKNNARKSSLEKFNLDNMTDNYLSTINKIIHE